MEFKEYIIAWLSYMAACSALILIGWSWTKNWWPWLRDAVRLLAVCLMLVPIRHENDPSLLVPASTVAILGWVTGEEEAMVHAVSLLLLVAVVALLVVLAAAVLRYRAAGKEDASEQVAGEETAELSASDSESGPASN